MNFFFYIIKSLKQASSVNLTLQNASCLLKFDQVPILGCVYQKLSKIDGLGFNTIVLNIVICIFKKLFIYIDS